MAAHSERYAEISETLADHPKTTRACKRLKIHRLMLVGHLVCFWNWAIKYAPDGDLSRCTFREISDAARFTDQDEDSEEEDKKADKFVAALIECRINERSSGFLTVTGACLTIHDWDQYGGKLNEKRLRNANKVAEWRLRNQDSNGYVTVTEPSHAVTRATHATERSGAERNGTERNEAEHSGADTEARAPAASGEQSSTEKKGRVKFVKPTKIETADFFKKEGSTGPEAGKFWNFYESKGWVVGKSPMKDWMSSAQNWIARNRDEGGIRASPAASDHDPNETALDRAAKETAKEYEAIDEKYQRKYAASQGEAA